MHAAPPDKTASNSRSKTHHTALLHSLRACITTALLAALCAANGQTAPPNATQNASMTHEQAYQNSLREHQTKYDADVLACAKHIATAQCKRQARLSQNKNNHEAKLLRAQARSHIKNMQHTQKAAPTAPKKPGALAKNTPKTKKPMAAKAPPPKGKTNAPPLSAQPSPEARRAHVAKQAALEDSLTQRKAQANSKKAQRDAKNQARSDLGYAVDARPGPQ